MREAEFTFEVDLGSQGECGLPLDMRPVRELLRTEVAGKHFACLLAHAGAPTTYAAAGGAASTVTVDSSKVFLEQAERTIRANGFDGRGHAFVQEDALEWAAAQAKAGRTFDMVFCDLSAFPKSKDNDEAALCALVLERVARILAPEGVLLLACRDRRFKLPGETLATLGLNAREITTETIARDFSRTPKIHRAFLISSC